MRHRIKNAFRLSISILLVFSFLPTQQAKAYIPDNAAATVSKWTGIANDYLSSSGLSGYVIDDLKNNLGGVCYGLTLGQVVVDIAGGDYGKAWNTCQQTGIETMIGATAASPFYAAGKLVWSALQGVQETALKSFTGKFFKAYKDARIDNVNWDKVRENKPSDWLPAWLARGKNDFDDFWFTYGDSGALNASYRNSIINQMKADCSFTAKLITFGSCNQDIMHIHFSEKEIKEWLYNNWEPLVIREVMNRAVEERRDYLNVLKNRTTFRILWSLDVELGEPAWSTFNGHHGVKQGDEYSVTLRYPEGIQALSKSSWMFAYGTKVDEGMVGALPNDVVKIKPPANLNLSKGMGSEVIVNMGKIVLSSTMGILSVENTGNESVSIFNIPLGSIEAKSKKGIWLPEGNYRLKTSIGIRSATVTAGQETSLSLARPAPPPPPPPTQSSVQGVIDQMVSNIRSGLMGRDIGLEVGFSWKEHKELIKLETNGVVARINYPDGTEAMGDLNAWAMGYIKVKEDELKNEANEECGDSLINELIQLEKETANFEQDQGLKFGYGSNVNDPTFGSLPEPGDIGWKRPPHGRVGGPNGDLIAETWNQKLNQSRMHIQEVINAKEQRLRDMEVWMSSVKGTVESLEKRYLFLHDWSTVDECRQLEIKADALSTSVDYQMPNQVSRLKEEIKKLEDLLKQLQVDESNLNQAISSYKNRVDVLRTDLSNLLDKCGEARSMTDHVRATIKSVKEKFNIGKFLNMRTPMVNDPKSHGEIRQEWAHTLSDWWDVFPLQNLPKPSGGGSYMYFLQQGDPTQKYIDFTKSQIFKLATAYSNSYIVNEISRMEDQLDGDAMEDAGQNVLDSWKKIGVCRDQLKMKHGSSCAECPELLDKLSKLEKWWNEHKTMLTHPLPSEVKKPSVPSAPNVPKPPKTTKPVAIKKATITVKLDIDKGINPSVVKTRILDQRGNLVMKGKGPYTLEPGQYIVNTYGMYIETDPMSAHVALAAGEKKVVEVRVWQDEEEEDDYADGNTGAGEPKATAPQPKRPSSTKPKINSSNFSYPYSNNTSSNYPKVTGQNLNYPQISKPNVSALDNKEPKINDDFNSSQAVSADADNHNPAVQDNHFSSFDTGSSDYFEPPRADDHISYPQVDDSKSNYSKEGKDTFHYLNMESLNEEGFSLAGNWVGNGHHVVITENGLNVTATAQENKGPVGWKIAKGDIKGDTVTMNFNGLILLGKISTQRNSISWSNHSTWTRVPSDFKAISSSRPLSELSCQNKDNEENGCCCFKGAHTYLFDLKSVNGFRATYDTGKGLSCQSKVKISVQREDKTWDVLKTIDAVSGRDGSEVAPNTIPVNVSGAISGVRIEDGCVCCLDDSHVEFF